MVAAGGGDGAAPPAARRAGKVCALMAKPFFTSPSRPIGPRGRSFSVTAIPPALPTERSTSCRASNRWDSPSLSTRFRTVVPSTFASTQLLRRASTVRTIVPAAMGSDRGCP